MSIELLHDRAIVGGFTASEQLFGAVFAFTTSNVEGSNNSVARLDIGYLGANLLDDAHAFMAHDIAILELHDFTMVQMQIRATDCILKCERQSYMDATVL